MSSNFNSVDHAHEYDFQLGDYHSPLLEALETPRAFSAAETAWFDRGMIWTFGFHHEEAVRCFARCPDSVLARFMIAYCLGPNYNKVWGAFAQRELLRCLFRARSQLQTAALMIQASALQSSSSSSSSSSSIYSHAAFLGTLLSALASRYGLSLEFSSDMTQFTFSNASSSSSSSASTASDALPMFLEGDHDIDVQIESASPPLPSPSDALLSEWTEAFASAMDTIWDEFLKSPLSSSSSSSLAWDLVTLVAEALLNRTPWGLWDLKRGTPSPLASTPRILAILEPFALHPGRLPPHPGLLHLYVHALEQSPHPQRALRAADALRCLVPDSGHLCHMPSHIDVLCGDYCAALQANARAVAADRKMLRRQGAVNFYSLYRCHDLHFQLYAALFLGQRAPALEAADELHATVPEQLLRVQDPPMADWLEGFLSVRYHCWIRFGMWGHIVDAQFPADPALYCVTTAMLHYAKGVAHAALGRTDEAALHLSQLKQMLYGRTQSNDNMNKEEEDIVRVPESRYLFVNKCVDILAVAEAMLEGELAYRLRQFDAAFAALRRAVALEDALPYDEPWGWMQPVRHALGALLLEQGHAEEAERAYRADLGLDATLQRSSHHPGNVWALLGLKECLERRNEAVEIVFVKKQLELALARCDVPVEYSCFCRLNEKSSSSCQQTACHQSCSK